MSSPSAAPPLSPLAGGTRSIGPFKATAQIAVGRRTTALLAYEDDPETLLVVRQVKNEIDGDVFEAEARGARVFEGHNSPELMRTTNGLVTYAPAIIGESLATILEHALAERRPLDLDVALAIAMGVASKLARTGEKRFHGDLAPHHVLIGYDGTIHLIDAACAAYRERMKAPGRNGYRSPEHVKAEPLAPSSDIFVLGILLFEMTTATRLFDTPAARDTDAAIVEARLPRPRDLVGDGYPIELQLVLRKLLRPAQAGRFPDGASARDALRLVAGARAELTQAQLGNWLRTLLPDRWSSWRMLLSPQAIAAIEDPSPVPKNRPSSRSPTVHIPADPTEPLVRAAPPPPPDAARTIEATFSALLKSSMPNEATAVEHRYERNIEDTEVPLGRTHEPIALYRRVSSSKPNPAPFAPRPNDDEASAYATKLALENIESLDDLPPRSKRESSTRRDLRAIPAQQMTPAPDLTPAMDPTPLPESEPELFAARDTDELGSPKSLQRMSSLREGTPTPLMEMELVGGQLVGPGGQRMPIDVVKPAGRLNSGPRASGVTPTPLLEVDLLAVAPAMPFDDRDVAPNQPPELDMVGAFDASADPFADFEVSETSDDISDSGSAPEDQAPEWLADGEVEFLSDSSEPEELEKRPLSNVADDLLLPARTPAPRVKPALDLLTRDLLGDREFDDAPGTVRAAAPQLSIDDDTNDTIDEGSSEVEALPDALVAQVLAEADVAREGDDEATRDDRSAGKPLREHRDHYEQPTYDEIRPPPQRSFPHRDDTPPMHRPPSHSSQVHHAHVPPPRADTEPMGDAGRARMQALAKNHEPSTIAHPQRGRLNIPAGATIPAAARPNLVMSRPDSAQADLWSSPRQLEDQSTESNVPTQVTRDRIERQAERTPQARVPTLIVRERVVSNDPASNGEEPTSPRESVARERESTTRENNARETPRDQRRERMRERVPVSSPRGGIRVREPVIPHEDTSSSLVIPIPDDELDRAARKKKLTMVLTIVGLAFAGVVLIAALLVFLLRGDEIPLSYNTVPPPAPKVVPAAPPQAVNAPIEEDTPTIEPMPVVVTATPAATATATVEVKKQPIRTQPAPRLPQKTRVQIFAMPRGAQILADGKQVENGGFVDVGGETVELVVSLDGYTEKRSSIQPGMRGPLNILLRAKKNE